MNKKVIIIATLVFALIFIVLLAILMGTITSKTNEANTKLVDTLDMTEGLELSNYDGATLKGNAVITAINNGKSLGGKNKLWMYVETSKGDKVYGYGTADSSGGGNKFQGMREDFDTSTQSKIHNGQIMSDSTPSIYSASNYLTYSAPESIDDNYISESAEFRSYLVRNGNDVVIGMHFIQIKDK